MEYQHVEVEIAASPKRAGQPSGDVVKVVRSPGWTTVVCCDGMGSGIRANVAAQLHSARLLELEKQGLSLRDAFARVVATIHEDRGKNPMYAALTVARILHSGESEVLTYDMPAPILASVQHASVLPQRLFHADAALLGESHCHLNEGEGLCLVSDGVTQSGIGKGFRDGWGIENAARCLDTVLGRKAPLEGLAGYLHKRALQTWGDKAGDDVTVVLAHCRSGKQLSILTGPPRQQSLDKDVVARFLATPGWKVVCGATSAKIVARQMGKKVEMDDDFQTLIAPPSYRIDGIDLVTEGAITLNQVYNILDEDPSRYDEWSGVTQLCGFLRDADRVHFFLGTACNPANQDISFQQKGILPRTRTVPLIRDRLIAAGKLVVVDVT
jgi:hypothetical protein